MSFELLKVDMASCKKECEKYHKTYSMFYDLLETKFDYSYEFTILLHGYGSVSPILLNLTYEESQDELELMYIKCNLSNFIMNELVKKLKRTTFKKEHRDGDFIGEFLTTKILLNNIITAVEKDRVRSYSENDTNIYAGFFHNAFISNIKNIKGLKFNHWKIADAENYLKPVYVKMYKILLELSKMNDKQNRTLKNLKKIKSIINSFYKENEKTSGYVILFRRMYHGIETLYINGCALYIDISIPENIIVNNINDYKMNGYKCYASLENKVNNQTTNVKSSELFIQNPQCSRRDALCRIYLDIMDLYLLLNSGQVYEDETIKLNLYFTVPMFLLNQLDLENMDKDEKIESMKVYGNELCITINTLLPIEKLREIIY